MTRVSLALYSGDPARGGFDPRNAGADRGDRSHTLKEANMDNDNNVGGYEIPVDPMDLLQCDSCQ